MKFAVLMAALFFVGCGHFGKHDHCGGKCDGKDCGSKTECSLEKKSDCCGDKKDEKKESK